jgi:hypothetical protein
MPTHLIDRAVWSPPGPEAPLAPAAIGTEPLTALAPDDAPPQDAPPGAPPDAPPRAGDPGPLAEGGPLASFVSRRHRVPSFSRSYHFHGVSGTNPPDPELLRTLRPLQGKFTVVNPTPTFPLPYAMRRRIEWIARAARRRGGIAVALEEPIERLVRHDTVAAGAGEIRFVSELLYRLTVTVGTRDAAPGEEARVLRVSRPVPWFAVALLTPDAEALRLMDQSTQHFYRHVTGRMGAGSRDSYWFADTWERFHEPGRIVGCIHPDVLDHAIPVHAGAVGPAADATPSEEAFLFSPTMGERSTWGEYTPRTERRFFPPPGYCLIRYGCWLELALAEATTREEVAA